MKIAIGNDHAGTALKMKVINSLSSEHEFINFGTDAEDSVDYPDFAHPVANAVERGEADLGILICGSGNGVCMTANKHKGVRAALAWNPELGALGRQHNNANVLCLPSRFITEDMALQIVEAFLSETFEGGRHERRVGKISQQDAPQ